MQKMNGVSCTVNPDWTLLPCLNKLKIGEELWVCETFIIVEKRNVVLEGKLKKDENGFMVQLDLPCFVFDKMSQNSFNASWK